MLKKILAIVAMLYAAVCFAAVDVNKASAAELDGVKGIGPAISTKILDERKKGPFKDWNDFVTRVKGIGEKSAAKLSAEGLTVNGAALQGAPAVAKPAEKAVSTVPATVKVDAAAATKAGEAAAPKPAASAAAAKK
ncbi:MAG: helix-hairpin-helix domain-containing protein [Betaproteobacteria bacterium]